MIKLTIFSAGDNEKVFTSIWCVNSGVSWLLEQQRPVV